MKLGLYSEIARRDVVHARAFIAAHGYSATDGDIRRCRQDMLRDVKWKADFAAVTKSRDFYSISACRDLLFHVQEQRMTLPRIDEFIRENDLSFIGFELDPHVLRAYGVRFPEDRAATNVVQWQIFEQENPDTFRSMYTFWLQKK